MYLILLNLGLPTFILVKVGFVPEYYGLPTLEKHCSSDIQFVGGDCQGIFQAVYGRL